MRKLDLILENIRDEYMINLLEEGTSSELETLKTKKFLNENLNRIRKMLIEEGALEGVKQHLGDNWGKYLAGAGAAGAGALGADAAMDAGYGEGLAGIAQSGMPAGEQATALGELAGAGVDQAGAAIGNMAGQAGDAIGAGVDQAGAAIGDLAGQAGDAYGAVTDPQMQANMQAIKDNPELDAVTKASIIKGMLGSHMRANAAG